MKLATDPRPAPAEAADSIRYVGDYELLAELGRGGMGIVYQAKQRSLNRLVAVKLLLSGSFSGVEAHARFRREAEAAARLRHPHIVRIHELGEHEGQPYFSMDYIPGQSLAEALAKGRTWTPEAAAELVRVAAEALHAAHQAGVLHRDIKPGNILLDRAGIPYLTDFGLAKLVDATDPLTIPGDTVGTPSYIAPEQVDPGPNQPGPAADLYSLGAVFYHLLTGRPPHVAPTRLALIRRVLEGNVDDPVALRPEIPRKLADICLRCLRLEPSERFGSAGQLALALSQWQAGLAAAAGSDGTEENSRPTGEARPAGRSPTPKPPGPARATRPEPAPAPGPRSNLGWVGAGIALVLLAIGAGVFLRRDQPPGGSGRVASFEAARYEPDQVVRENRFTEALGELQENLHQRPRDTNVAGALVRLLALTARVEPDGPGADLGGAPVAWGSDPRARWLAVALSNGDLQVWDLLRQVRHAVLPGLCAGVPRLAFTPDGSRLAVADDLGLQWLDPVSGTARRLANERGRLYRQVVVSTNLAWVAAVSATGDLEVVPTAEPGVPASAHPTPPQARVDELQLSPSGHWWLMRSPDGTVQAWNAPRREAVRVGPPSATVVRMEYWAAANQVVVEDQDGTLTFWEPATGREVGRLDRAVAGASRWKAAGNGEQVVIWRANGQALVATPGRLPADVAAGESPGSLKAGALSPDAQYQATVWKTSQGTTLRVSALREPAPRLASLELADQVELVGFAGHDGLVTLDVGGRLHWWRLAIHEGSLLPLSLASSMVPELPAPLPAWFPDWVAGLSGRLSVTSAAPVTVARRPSTDDPGELATWARWTSSPVAGRPVRWKETRRGSPAASSAAGEAAEAGLRLRLESGRAEAWLGWAEAWLRLPPAERPASIRELRHAAQRALELAPENAAVRRRAGQILESADLR